VKLTLSAFFEGRPRALNGALTSNGALYCVLVWLGEFIQDHTWPCTREMPAAAQS
jgi:hypothetical protein